MNKIFRQSSIQLLGLLLLVLSSFFLIYSCGGTDEDNKSRPGAYDQNNVQHAFVGDKTCQSCHSYQFDEWKGSHHDYAIAEADEESVRGDFENAEFTQGENSYRFYRNGSDYMVEVRELGVSETYKIDYTFGWEPLQQYLIEIGDGKMQALHIAWDTEQNRWFSLQPDAEYEPDDWMHWKGGSMNWNTMCADCHSTNLKKNFEPETDSFHTTWSVLNVSCEACHGPGKNHVDFVSSAEGQEASKERIRQDVLNGRFTSQMEEINTCAPCHSLRQKLTDNYTHGDNFLNHFDPQLPHPGNYFADGQIRGEVYVYGSFLQSKMYAEGVQCTDCHNPHTLELKQPLIDNQLCMSCHEPRYNTPEHHYHEPNTEQSQCINCHMDGRIYMGNDYRRDHSFRIPRPDQSAQFGTPNACNSCHTDQSLEWAAKAVNEWYGSERNPHYSDVFLNVDAGEPDSHFELHDLFADESQNEIVRATAVWYAGQFPDSRSNDIIRAGLQSESALIRTSAVKAADKLPVEMRRLVLSGSLDDDVRSVRLFAFRSLAGFTDDDFDELTREHFQRAKQEYTESLEVSRYFPQGEMNRGQFLEQQGEIDEAIESYRTVLERDPYFNPARINLAYLLNGRGENEEAEELLRTVTEQEPEYGQAYYSLALLLAEEERLSEAVDYFEKAAQLSPEQSRIFYNLAVAHQTLGNPSRAEEVYLKAIQLEPRNGDNRYGLITLYMQQEQFEKALEQAQELENIFPGNQQVLQLINMIRQRQG